jgi:hypothetical protein
MENHLGFLACLNGRPFVVPINNGGDIMKSGVGQFPLQPIAIGGLLSRPSGEEMMTSAE